jgi:hypothetical protein
LPNCRFVWVSRRVMEVLHVPKNALDTSERHSEPENSIVICMPGENHDSAWFVRFS